MKFVIRSLLFVNLLLQMINSLKQCFNHHQNIMITIILLAFSVIGLIGLVIGNRFILIIFSASMTLILIASITIYAIGKTEEDVLKPKVPYFTNRDLSTDSFDANGKRIKLAAGDDSYNGLNNKFKSLVNRWLKTDKNKEKDEMTRGRTRTRTYNKTRSNSGLGRQQRQNLSMLRMAASSRKQTTLLQQRTATLTPPQLEDLSDESTSEILSQDMLHDERSMSKLDKERQSANLMKPATTNELRGQRLTMEMPNKRLSSLSDDQEEGSSHDRDEEEEDDTINGEKVENEQWIAYERYLYERYLYIVSQSIDLVMHTILAAWMALLLDEDSDQCFGPKASSSSSAPAAAGQTGVKAPPVYNYNGVRYSIRPDVDDSLARVVVS